MLIHVENLTINENELSIYLLKKKKKKIKIEYNNCTSSARDKRRGDDERPVAVFLLKNIFIQEGGRILDKKRRVSLWLSGRFSEPLGM